MRSEAGSSMATGNFHLQGNGGRACAECCDKAQHSKTYHGDAVSPFNLGGAMPTFRLLSGSSAK